MMHSILVLCLLTLSLVSSFAIPRSLDLVAQHAAIEPVLRPSPTLVNRTINLKVPAVLSLPDNILSLDIQTPSFQYSVCDNRNVTVESRTIALETDFFPGQGSIVTKSNITLDAIWNYHSSRSGNSLENSLEFTIVSINGLIVGHIEFAISIICGIQPSEPDSLHPSSKTSLTMVIQRFKSWLSFLRDMAEGIYHVCVDQYIVFIITTTLILGLRYLYFRWQRSLVCDPTYTYLNHRRSRGLEVEKATVCGKEGLQDRVEHVENDEMANGLAGFKAAVELVDSMIAATERRDGIVLREEESSPACEDAPCHYAHRMK